jgi:hypothetical protein
MRHLLSMKSRAHENVKSPCKEVMGQKNGARACVRFQAVKMKARDASQT